MLANTLDTRDRIAVGRRREHQIMEVLKRQCGLSLMAATDAQDQEQKVDCWLNQDGQKVPVQIKYRESGEDLLVEVFDLWHDWDHKGNKVGRDMVGKAQKYAVLSKNAKTITMTQTATIKELVCKMLTAAQNHGWTENKGPQCKTLRYHANGQKCELKVQRDPRSGNTKMMAYIPAKALLGAEQFQVTMPKTW